MGILFSLLSPALFAVNNYIDKVLLEKFKIHPTVVAVYSGFFTVLAGLIVLFFTGFYPADIKSIAILLASGFLTALYLLPYCKGLSLDETSRIVPLFQLTPVFVLILSFLLLGEKLVLKQYMGSFLIIFAGFLILSEKPSKNIFKLRPAFWYIALSCLMFALAQVLYKFGVQEIPFWHTLPYESFGIALGAIVILLFPKNKQLFVKETRRFTKKVYTSMAINEFVYVMSRYTGYFAISLISVSIVSVLSGFQSVFALIYGVVLTLFVPKIIKEGISKKTLGIKIFSIAIMFVGLYLIFS
mgnify:CR=1 FL=1